MTDTIEEYMELMYRLDYLVRYSNVPRIHDESVASHSFFVAAIVIKLHEKYKFDLSRAVLMAVCHDIPEARTNDVSHEIQKLYPEIKEALRAAEARVLDELPSAIKSAVIEYNTAATIEARVVHLADALQCNQYASHEVQMGNKGYMLEVVNNSQIRIDELEVELEAFLK